jgi:hypothetical protein
MECRLDKLVKAGRPASRGLSTLYDVFTITPKILPNVRGGC